MQANRAVGRRTTVSVRAQTVVIGLAADSGTLALMCLQRRSFVIRHRNEQDANSFVQCDHMFSSTRNYVQDAENPLSCAV